MAEDGCESEIKIPECVQFCTKFYEIYEKIGEGTFSTVYGGVCRETGMRVAIKAITRTTAPQRLYNELMILDILGGLDNCIPLLKVHREKDQVVAVFPLVTGTDFLTFLATSTDLDVKKYMYNLLRAVKHVHKHDIIHRDLKPNNFIYNKETGEGYLIDFGLAHKEKVVPQAPPKPKQPIIFFNSIVLPSKPPGYYEDDNRRPMKAPRAGTRGFRAPEVLFKSYKQTKAIDIWSVGVIFLSILTSQYPFFLSAEDIDGLAEIGTLFGHLEMRKAARIYDRVWKSNLPSIKEEKTSFESLISHLNPSRRVDSNGIDLLEKMLDLNYETRITAEKALEHPYFREIYQ